MRSTRRTLPQQRQNAAKSARKTWHHAWIPGGLWPLARRSFFSVVLFSALANVLLLTSPMFMLQIYDRVLTSHSIPTLMALAALAFVLIGFFALFDLVRQRVLVRLSMGLYRRLAGPVFERTMHRDSELVTDQPLNDLASWRQFMAGPGPVALLDLPWMPVFLFIIYLLHPLLGIIATLGGVVILALAGLNQIIAACASEGVFGPAQSARQVARTSVANHDALQAMDMSQAMAARWRSASDEALRFQLPGDDGAGAVGAGLKAVRLVVQVLLLGVGAWLVIDASMTAGAMIAASIIGARALAPVESAAAHWRGLLEMRAATRRLNAVLAGEAAHANTQLPAPQARLSVEKITLIPPGAEKPTLRQVAFSLETGQGLSVVGPSAAGKSSLARALAGIWEPNIGSIRLDGATLDQWQAGARGRHIGYLPQDIQLFSGTIADNIARFSNDASDAEIVAAAQLAGIHDQIVRLPEGYNTLLAEGGANLSGGQRQGIGLARALYSMPFLIILDEPNANLDGKGEAALVRAIRAAREAGSIVVVMAHRPSVVAATDMTLMLSEGRMQAFGPRDEVLRRVIAPATDVTNETNLSQEAGQVAS